VVYAREQRPWSGPEPPAAVFVCAGSQSRTARSHLEDFKGVLHVDGYAGFEQLAINGDVVLAACWAHTRHKFYEVAEATGSPVAARKRAGSESSMSSKHACAEIVTHRLAERRSFSGPIVQALHAWLEAQLTRVPGRSTLAEAIRYALSRWKGLTRFLNDGRIELDTNPVERAIRPVALGRKNPLFAGSDGGGDRWAIVCSLIETCKLNGVEPYAYLTDVKRMVEDTRQPARRTAALDLESGKSCQDLTDASPDAYIGRAVNLLRFCDFSKQAALLISLLQLRAAFAISRSHCIPGGVHVPSRSALGPS
jgi:hypothetical protein